MAAKWGPSVGLFQIRTLVNPLAWGTADRVRDVGVLAGREPGVGLAPDLTTYAAALNAQCVAAKKVRDSRDWSLWSVHPSSGKDPSGAYRKFNEGYGKDFVVQLGHPERGRWNLKGVK